MATYVVGDVQGCFGSLERLLASFEWRPGRDEVWLAGDLVNRGRRSLEVLRWAREWAQVVVLGNHDLHLLAVSAGLRSARRGDTLDPILVAPDRDDLLAWLRTRPLLHLARDPSGVGEWALVHAGLLPAWTRADAIRLAEEAQQRLAGPESAAFLRGVFSGKERARDPVLLATKVMTSIRCVGAKGDPLDDYKGDLADRPPGAEAWFEAPGRAWAGRLRVLFGHWAALGIHLGREAVGLDSGCVWGRALSAYRIEDARVFSVPADPADLRA